MKNLRKFIGLALSLVLALGMVLVSSYLSFMAALTVPQRFATLTSPSGKRKVVVLRQVDTDESRLNERRAARLEADPEGDAEYVLQDYGYVYRAYPTALGLFYRSKADVEGEITVDMLETEAVWFGVTYQEDRPLVQQALLELHAKGVYPEKL